MSQAFNDLIKSFDKALADKEKGKFDKEDVKEIYEAAHVLFDGKVNLTQSQIEQIRDRWVKLAEGKIDKGGAIKKLHGTSRAEAIRSVLLSSL